MPQIFQSGIRGFSGRYIGYVRYDGSVFRGGFNFEGGTYVGYFRGSHVYRGGWNGEGGKYIGSSRWNQFECNVFESPSGFEGGEDERLIGRVAPDGSLFGGGYHLPDTQKFKGYAKDFVWDAPNGHGAGAAILLLLSN